MLLYSAPMPAPNPRRVRIFLAEKGVTVPIRDLSLRDGDHKKPEFVAINPMGQAPTLLLDDGRALTESVSICRYFESLHPEPPLFGVDAYNAAEIDVWLRRVEFRLQRALGLVWQHTHPFTAHLVKPQYKEFGETQRKAALAYMRELDTALADREWLDGRAYTIADIVLLSCIDFGLFIGVTPPEDLRALGAWHQRATTRPSSKA
ncbi:MAG: glutathione S-transferase family protein [Alphaproteobacteria bacterium]|nr:glutathione S-transferase family protein [Alphaproteobacteria bacterium]